MKGAHYTCLDALYDCKIGNNMADISSILPS